MQPPNRNSQSTNSCSTGCTSSHSGEYRITATRECIVPAAHYARMSGELNSMRLGSSLLGFLSCCGITSHPQCQVRVKSRCTNTAPGGTSLTASAKNAASSTALRTLPDQRPDRVRKARRRSRRCSAPPLGYGRTDLPHLQALPLAYNYSQRLRTLPGLTPHKGYTVGTAYPARGSCALRAVCVTVPRR